MPCNYQELEINPVQSAPVLCEPSFFPKGEVSLEDPAIKVMTDLKFIAAITISPSSSLEEATDRMIKTKVKLLFVTDPSEQLAGLITYSDLQGERPILFQQHNGVQRSEIIVGDIMTRTAELDAIDWSIVERAKVGDIAMTLKKLNRQHALVVDKGYEDTPYIRGIFSTSQLSKMLGVYIDTAEVAQTFAELERVLGCK